MFIVSILRSTQIACVGENPLNGCNTVVKTSCIIVSFNILSVNTLTTNPNINTLGSRFATVRFTTIHFTTLVESDRALPTCDATLSQLRPPFSN